jgi:CheY-like chemotaxis protein
MKAWRGQILVVEDSELNAILIRFLAEQLGWKCDWSESVERLQKRLNTNPNAYDFILLDQHLDAQKGAKWLKQYFTENPSCQTPFIGISAQFFESDVHDLVRAGISGIFPKPISKENLLTIQKALIAKELQGFSDMYFSHMFGNSPLVSQSFKVFLNRLLAFKNESISGLQNGHWNRSLGLTNPDSNPELFQNQLQHILQHFKP